MSKNLILSTDSFCFQEKASILKEPVETTTGKVYTQPSDQLTAVCTYRLVMTSIKWSETAQKNTLDGRDVIVTQLLRYHMPLLYFVCNHLISLFISKKGHTGMSWKINNK